MKTIIANWKMNVGVRESVALARATLLTLRGRRVIPELVVCPPYVALSEVRKVVARSHVALGSQNMSWEAQGSFTGEISPRMLEELGVSHVLIGHSERRQLLHEDDDIINRKLKKALDHDLVPVLCIGESAQQREAGDARDVINAQLARGLDGARLNRTDRLFVAYEPIWAIGKGKSAELGQVLEMHGYIRDILAGLFSGIDEGQVRVLYGGSVDADNAYRFLREDQVDGVLVGSASIKINQFNDIVSAASEVLEARA
jgi:triosephosphate isomerase (TIM)